jgi:hypothetical protein
VRLLPPGERNWLDTLPILCQTITFSVSSEPTGDVPADPDSNVPRDMSWQVGGR